MRSPLAAALVLLALLGAAAPAPAQEPEPAPACPARAAEAPLMLVEGVRAACTTRPAERAVVKWAPAGPGGTAVVDLEGTTYDVVVDVHVLNGDGSLGRRVASWDQGDARAAEYVAFDVGSASFGFSVRGYRTSDAGTVAIKVDRGPAPNVAAGAAQPVAFSADGTAAVGMSWRSAPVAGIGTSVPARWYAITAPRTGRMTASTCTAYAADTSITAYGAEGDELAENDDTPLRCDRRGASFVGFPVVAGRAYLVAVRLASGDGGAETLTLGWDDAAPVAYIGGGPSAVTAERTASFAWGSPASDAIGFECSLDGGGFGACSDRYAGLADGDHTFRVRALDAAGNVGAAVERRWRVATTAAAGGGPAPAGTRAASGGAVSASSSSRSRVIGVKSERFNGPRAARARALALAFTGGPAARFAAGRRGTAVLKLSLAGVAPGTAVELRCERRANGCPFTVRRVARYGGADLARLFRGRRLEPGAVIELRVTRPNTVGRLFRWQVGKRKRPAGVALCLPPGTAEPSRC